jgi:hypothetical protein
VRDALRSSFSVMVAVHGDHITRADYPQTLELAFDGAEPAYVSAARLTPEGAEGFTNHLLVLFGRPQLEAHGLG